MGEGHQSDIDILVIINERIDESVRYSLALQFLKISSFPVSSDGVRPLDIVFVVKDDFSPWHHPVKKEFFFGEWLREDFEKGLLPSTSFDSDLTLILAMVLNSNIKLFGDDAHSVIPSIPMRDIRKAIKESVLSVTEQIIGDERNVLLTLARMLATLETGEFFSKNQAIDKILDIIPPEHQEILLLARDSYLGQRSDDWSLLSDKVNSTTECLKKMILT